MLTKVARYISFRPISVLTVLLMLVLAACGSPTTGTGSAPGGSTSTPAPTATHGTATGCPNKTTVNTQPAAASVVLNNTGVNTTATVKRGDIVEIDLPFGHNWSGPTNSAQGLLLEQDPSGYASPTGHVCVWRFLAASTGTAEINFTGRPICQKGQLCPMYIMAAPFTIKIQ